MSPSANNNSLILKLFPFIREIIYKFDVNFVKKQQKHEIVISWARCFSMRFRFHSLNLWFKSEDKNQNITWKGNVSLFLMKIFFDYYNNLRLCNELNQNFEEMSKNQEPFHFTKKIRSHGTIWIIDQKTDACQFLCNFSMCSVPWSIVQFENLQSAFETSAGLDQFLAILGRPFGRVLKITQ